VAFLDEVGGMSLAAQAKFLRVLEEREFQRLGGTRILKTNARIIAATNRDLLKAIERGQFREDLYYRLNVFAIHLPPLRDRRDDRRLKATGHDVLPVNPHMQTFEGDRCYPNVDSIPGGVEGVVIVTRPEATERIVRECADAGVRRVWLHQSMGKGTSVSSEAVEYCRQRDISVIAGACPMMYGPGVDFGHACMRWVIQAPGGRRTPLAPPREPLLTPSQAPHRNAFASMCAGCAVWDSLPRVCRPMID